MTLPPAAAAAHSPKRAREHGTEGALQGADLVAALKSLVEGETNLVANLANASSLLFHSLSDLNWCGFYLVDAERQDELVVGPFQGRPACVRIKFGRGVCGTAAHQRKTIEVPDVHKFPGHIACDSASQSEVVVPLITRSGRLVGVLDIDSPSLSRFSKAEDLAQIEAFAAALVTACWPDS